MRRRLLGLVYELILLDAIAGLAVAAIDAFAAMPADEGELVRAYNEGWDDAITCYERALADRRL